MFVQLENLFIDTTVLLITYAPSSNETILFFVEKKLNIYAKLTNKQRIDQKPVNI